MTVRATSKAVAIRARLTEKPLTQDPHDTDTNAAIFAELEALSKKTGLQTYIVMWGEVPVALIILKSSEKQCTAIVTKFVNGHRVMFKQSASDHRVIGGAKGANCYGYDKETAALTGLTIPSVHSYYEQAKSPAHFVLRDGGERWYQQLQNNGFKLWRTL